MLSMSKDDGEVFAGWTEELQQRMAAAGAVTDPTRYRKETNNEGIVRILTLPGGTKDNPRTETVSVWHDDYEQPASDDNRLRRRTSVQLVQGEVTEVTIVMDKKGTKVLGE